MKWYQSALLHRHLNTCPLSKHVQRCFHRFLSYIEPAWPFKRSCWPIRFLRTSSPSPLKEIRECAEGTATIMLPPFTSQLKYGADVAEMDSTQEVVPKQRLYHFLRHSCNSCHMGGYRFYGKCEGPFLRLACFSAFTGKGASIYGRRHGLLSTCYMLTLSRGLGGPKWS
jgi:hypothetical protein